jgi:hypothetical protein
MLALGFTWAFQEQSFLKCDLILQSQKAILPLQI